MIALENPIKLTENFGVCLWFILDERESMEDVYF